MLLSIIYVLIATTLLIINACIDNSCIRCVDLIFYFVITLVYSYLMQLDLSEMTIIDTQEIIPLKDDNSSNKHTYVGKDSVNTNTYYYYYVKSNNGFKKQKRKTNRCIIIASATDTPHVDTVIMDVAADRKNTLAYKLLAKHLIRLKTSKFYKIYVPEDSLTEDFIIEME